MIRCALQFQKKPEKTTKMSILFQREKGTLTLLTDHTAYQMQIGPEGYLLHTYYGRACAEDFRYLHLERDCGFSPNPYALSASRGFSLDTMPQEYSGSNGADFRLPCVLSESEDGILGVDLRYVRHEIRKGVFTLEGLPTAFAGEDGEAETLSVLLRDEATGLETELLYGVFPHRDVITRAVRIRNGGEKTVRLRKAASACLDLPFGAWDCIDFHGRHAMERQTERTPVSDGIRTISSERGYSGHQHNPFVILCDREGGEDHGECYGLMLCYSGNHQTEMELDQTGSLRVVSGIGERFFRWTLEPGARFDTPQLLMCFSADGLGELSRRFHRFIRRNLCHSPWTGKKRPVLLNSWEAAYLNFDEALLLRLAKNAKQLGVELLVLDDGWFGDRDEDNRALGDWTPNLRKLPDGLGGLIRRVKNEGLKFGLWIEPEMVSENSDLFRAHPDWALRVPGRQTAIGRNQMVLDLSRPEITDWLYETVAGLLRENNIDYIKWDMNRAMTDLYSASLPADRQGELAHRYILGLYSVLARLTEEFPEVLFEGCAGGGGRFDAGMLAFHPQIWCSDNTDPIARLRIQEGTSYGYPTSAVGAHVSASPNHQTGRSTPFGTRAAVAMAGTFGYELDPAKLSEEERQEVRRQIAFFHRVEDLVREGDHYRLGAMEKERFTAWQFVSGDREKSLFTLVLTEPEGNPRPLHVRLKGLDPEKRYRLAATEYAGRLYSGEEKLPEALSGAALMYGGLTLPRLYGDYPSVQILLEAE